MLHSASILHVSYADEICTHVCPAILRIDSRGVDRHCVVKNDFHVTHVSYVASQSRSHYMLDVHGHDS